MLVGCGAMIVGEQHLAHDQHVVAAADAGRGRRSTGRSTQSELSPGAWLVLEPSKPQMPGSSPSAMILVFERSIGGRLGAVDPDVLSPVGHDSPRWSRGGRVGNAHRPSGGHRITGSSGQFPERLPECERYVNWTREGGRRRPGSLSSWRRWNASRTTCCARSRSAASASSASGSPTCWASSSRSPSRPPSSRTPSRRACTSTARPSTASAGVQESDVLARPDPNTLRAAAVGRRPTTSRPACSATS